MPRELSKCREWEKDRRERLKKGFSSLCKILPCYEPSINLSKIEILQKAQSYIEELQTQIKELLDEKSTKPECSTIKKLHDRVKKLLVRNEQLCNLLIDAGIRLPSECGNVKKFRGTKIWSNRITPEQAKKLLKKEKENDQKKPKKKIQNKNRKLKTSTLLQKKISRKSNANSTQPIATNLLQSSNFITLVTTQSCFIITNAPSTNINQNCLTKTTTVLTNSNLFSTPLVASTVKPPLVITKSNGAINTVSSGTLLVANGSLLPVIQQPTLVPTQTIITSPTPIVVKSAPTNNTTLFVVPKSDIKDATSNKLSPTLTSPSKTTSNTKATNVLKSLPLLKPKRNDITRTTHVNKVPIPALTSKYANDLISQVSTTQSSKPSKVKSVKSPKKDVNIKCKSNKSSPPEEQSKKDEVKDTKEDQTDEKTDENLEPAVKKSKLTSDTTPAENHDENKRINIISAYTIDSLCNDLVDATNAISNKSDVIEEIQKDIPKLPEVEDKNNKQVEVEKQNETPTVALSVQPEVTNDLKIQEINPTPSDSNNQDNKEESINDKIKAKQDRKDIDLNNPLMHSDLSNDIFASLSHVSASGGQNPESTSPTAAFLLAFPLVSSLNSLKVAEVIEDEVIESQHGTPTLLQIGTMDTTKTTQSQSDTLTPNLLNLDNFSFFSREFYPAFDPIVTSSSTICPPVLPTSTKMTDTKKEFIDFNINLTEKKISSSDTRVKDDLKYTLKSISSKDQCTYLSDNKNAISTSTNSISQNTIVSSICQNASVPLSYQSIPSVSICQNVPVIPICQSTSMPSISVCHSGSIPSLYPSSTSVLPVCQGTSAASLCQNSIVISHNTPLVSFCHSSSIASLCQGTSAPPICQGTCTAPLFQNSNVVSQNPTLYSLCQTPSIPTLCQSSTIPSLCQSSTIPSLCQSSTIPSLCHNSSVTLPSLRHTLPPLNQASTLITQNSIIPVCQTAPIPSVRHHAPVTFSNSNLNTFVSSTSTDYSLPYNHSFYSNASTITTSSTTTMTSAKHHTEKVKGQEKKMCNYYPSTTSYSVPQYNTFNPFTDIPKSTTYPISTKAYNNALYSNNTTYGYNYHSDNFTSYPSTKSNIKPDKLYYGLNYDNYEYKHNEFQKYDGRNQQFVNYYQTNVQNKEKVAIDTANKNNNLNTHTNNKVPVNWMTTPDVRQQHQNDFIVPSLGKDMDFGSNPIYSSNSFTAPQTTYFNTNSSLYSSNDLHNTAPFPTIPPNTFQRSELEENQFSWSPSKLPQLLDTTHNFVTGALPTLVGDLALGNTQPFVDSKLENKNMKDFRMKENARRSKTQINYDNQSNFLSVSQLVDHNKNESLPGRVGNRRNSGNRSSNKTSPSSKSAKRLSKTDKDVHNFNNTKVTEKHIKHNTNQEYQNQSGDNSNWIGSTNKVRNVKIPSNNYSAEALIGHQSQPDLNRSRNVQNYPMVNKSLPVPFLPDNIIPYFPMDIPQDNMQNQNYQSNAFTHNFPSGIQGSVYPNGSFVPNPAPITTSYLPSTNFISDIGGNTDYASILPENTLSHTIHRASDKFLKNKPVSVEKSNDKRNLTQSNSNCSVNPINTSKKSKKKHHNEPNLSNFDFSFLSMPAAINSPILPDDFHTHSNFLPPPTPTQLYPCKNPLYGKQDLSTNSLLPLPSSTRSGVAHPEVSPSLNNVGNTLTNFNLSTIFPEINKAPVPMSDIYADPGKGKDYNQREFLGSTSQVPFKTNLSYINSPRSTS